MAGFLYYEPDFTGTVTLANVREWGLGYAFTASPNGRVCMSNTPDGRTGSVFADSARLGEWQAVMQMDEQVWRKIPKSDCYVGFWKAAPPQPSELSRPTQIPGYQVTIGDYLWDIPLTARFDDSRSMLVTSLPCYMQMDDEGRWSESDVLDIHKHLWEIGQPFRDDMMRRMVGDGEAAEFSRQELYEAAVTYLQANYVVGPAEMALMRGFVNGPAVHSAVLAANDLPTFWEWNEQQKKNPSQPIAADSTTSNGEAGGPQDLSPPLLTS